MILYIALANSIQLNITLFTNSLSRIACESTYLIPHSSYSHHPSATFCRYMNRQAKYASLEETPGLEQLYIRHIKNMGLLGDGVNCITKSLVEGDCVPG